MEVSVGWHDLDILVEADKELAERVTQAIDAVDDAEVLAQALARVFGQR
jgi:hypothetical protein